MFLNTFKNKQTKYWQKQKVQTVNINVHVYRCMYRCAVAQVIMGQKYNNDEASNPVDPGSEWTPEVRSQINPVNSSSVGIVWTAAGPSTSSPCYPSSSSAASVQAPGLLTMMMLGRERSRGGGDQFSRAELLSTRTHSVQLLLLDQLWSIYKVPSIKEDEATCQNAGGPPEQNIGQGLGPGVTCRTQVVLPYFTLCTLKLNKPVFLWII